MISGNQTVQILLVMENVAPKPSLMKRTTAQYLRDNSDVISIIFLLGSGFISLSSILKRNFGVPGRKYCVFQPVGLN